MDAADIAWLHTPAGAAATREASELLVTSSELAALRRLGRRVARREARAAVALVLGRLAAAAKFEDAHCLFCDRVAAEQASQELVARHLAARFAGYEHVADLGCGMGGDTLALATHADVLAVDCDPARLAMTAANADVRGVRSRVSTFLADLTRWRPPPDIEAFWADPARRDTSGRRIRPEAWSPPLSRMLELAATVRGAGIKVAPGIALDVLPDDGEVEFVSVGRGIKAAVLWTGDLARGPRTATVLPEGATLRGVPDEGTTRLRPPGRFLHDPDPAVGRAGLVETLASRLGAWKLHASIAYLATDEAVESPFARRFAVRAWFPFSERRLLDELRAAGFGRVEVMRRGSPVDTNDLERRLNANLGRHAGGTAVAFVVLTRYVGMHIAMVCERG